ncbi:MAG: hypothetical protein QOJ04_4992 [Caballeronia sp.]|nr:hypothetical protein [Caballeronia sp.]
MADFVAFEKKVGETVAPAFWIETKCHFPEHTEGELVAGDVRDQIGIYFKKLIRTPPLAAQENESLRKQLIACDRHIVHFLNRIPRTADSLFPKFVLDKYAGPERKRSTPLDEKQLQICYKRVPDNWTYLAVGKRSRLAYDWSEYVSIATAEHAYAVVDAVVA